MINLTFLALCLWPLWVWEGEASSRVSSSVKDSHGSICRFLSENVVIGSSVHLPVTLMLICQLTRSLAGCPHLGITSSMLTLLKWPHRKMSLGPAVPSNVHCDRAKAAASPNFLSIWKGRLAVLLAGAGSQWDHFKRTLSRQLPGVSFLRICL